MFVRTGPLITLALCGALGCSTSEGPSLRVVPDVMVVDGWASTELFVEGLASEDYLATSSEGLTLRDVEVLFDGERARIVGVAGGLRLRLDGPLPVGLHDLEVRGRHVRRRAAALEVLAVGADGGARDVDGSANDADVVARRMARCGGDDVVACWPFDVDLRDAGSRGNDLLGSGVAMMDDRCALFGPESSSATGDGATLEARAISITGWVRIDDAPAALGRSGIVEREGHYGLFAAGGGTLRCYVNVAGDDWAIAIGVLEVGQWHHVACVGEPEAVVLYLDGQEVARARMPVELGDPEADAPIVVGRAASGHDPLVGAIDELRIVDRLLDAADVVADREAGH